MLVSCNNVNVSLRLYIQNDDIYFKKKDWMFYVFFSWSHIPQVFLHNHFVLSDHVQIFFEAILF